MAGRSITKLGYDSDKGEMEDNVPQGERRRRSQRKSLQVERLQITHSTSPSMQSLTSKRFQNEAEALPQTSVSAGSTITSSATEPITSPPQQSVQPSYNGTHQNFLARDRYGAGGQGEGIHSGGTNAAGLPSASSALNSLISWAAGGTGLRDIRDPEIEEFLTTYWTTKLAVTAHALYRTLPVANDVFNRSHNEQPWKDQGNIVFLCSGGKIVRAHGVLLNAILPRFVSELMDIHQYVMVPTYNTSPHLPVFVRGIDAQCIEQFLTLSNMSMAFMSGREIMQLKRMIEVLNIHELSVFVAHSIGTNGSGLGGTNAATGSGNSNVLTSDSGALAVASSSSAQNFGVGTPANQLTYTQGVSANLMGSPFILSPRPRVSQSGEDLAAAKQPDEVRSLFQQEDSRSRKKGKGKKKKPIYANASAGAALLETSGNKSDVFDLNVSMGKPASEISTPLKLQGVSPFVSPSPRAMPLPLPLKATPASGGDRRRKLKVLPEPTKTPPPPPPVPAVERKRRSTRVKSESSAAKKQRESSEGLAVERSDGSERKKRTNYSREFREKVMLALNGGAAINSVSEQFNIDARTLSRWKYEKKRGGSDTTAAVENQVTTTNGHTSVKSDKDAAATLASDASSVNYLAEVASASSAVPPAPQLGTSPVPVAETPTIGFDSVLMKDPPIGNFFGSANPNAIYPQAVNHHSDLITFNNMTMAIQIPSHNLNDSGTRDDNRGKENVHTNLIGGTDHGQNPDLDIPSVVGMDLVVDSTNSIEIEGTN